MRAEKDWDLPEENQNAKIRPTPQPQGKSGAGFFVWFVLLLLIAGAAFAAIQGFAYKQATDALIKDYGERLSQFERLLERVDADASGDLRSMQQSIFTLEGQMVQVEKQLTQIEKQVGDDRQLMEQLAGTVQQLNTASSQLLKRLTAVETMAESSDSEIRKVAGGVRVIRGQVEAIQREIKSFDAVHAKLAELRNSDDAASKSIRGFDEHRRQLNRSLLQLKANMSSLANELEDLKKQIIPL